MVFTFSLEGEHLPAPLPVLPPPAMGQDRGHLLSAKPALPSPQERVPLAAGVPALRPVRRRALRPAPARRHQRRDGPADRLHGHGEGPRGGHPTRPSLPVPGAVCVHSRVFLHGGLKLAL